MREYIPSAEAAADGNIFLPQFTPKLPDAIMRRFGADAEQYNADLEKWWHKVRSSITESINENITPTVNQAAADVRKSFISSENAFALINEERILRINADEVLAASIETVSVGLDDVTVAITEETIARIAADGTIFARWGVAINVDGEIIGKIQLDGTNQSSSFLVQVDKFQVVNGNGTITLLDIRSNGIVFGAPIMSDNFVAGSAGWWADRNTGDAEFNNVVIRGAIIINVVSQPGISPSSSDFTSSVNVTLSGSGTIRYTTDGSEVENFSAVYSAPINITATTTIRAKAFDGLGRASPETQGTYTKVPSGGGGPGTPVYRLTLTSTYPLSGVDSDGLYNEGSIPISAPPTSGPYTFLQWDGDPASVARLQNAPTDPNNVVGLDADTNLIATYNN